MKHILNHLLQFIAFGLLLLPFSTFTACQNNAKGSHNQHIENILSIEKGNYWHNIVQTCLNSHRYAEAMPYLDSLKQYCNYYEEACYAYAWIHLNSSQDYYDEQKGVEYLLQAAYGKPECENKLNERLSRGYSGLPRAKFDLALSYLFGNYSIKKDEARGIQLLDTLSKSEFAGWRGSILYEDDGDFLGPKSKIMLASFYNNGLMGLPQDKRKAAKLWEEALVMTGKNFMDNADLLEIIGKEYKNTNNPYYKDVSAWLLNDAKPEEPTTQFLLALCYRHGKGVSKDIRRSDNMLQGLSFSQEMSNALYPLMDYICGN